MNETAIFYIFLEKDNVTHASAILFLAVICK